MRGTLDNHLGLSTNAWFLFTAFARVSATTDTYEGCGCYVNILCARVNCTWTQQSGSASSSASPLRHQHISAKTFLPSLAFPPSLHPTPLTDRPFIPLKR
uniref:Secreted protein n=1 Tax=Trypanosoma vivax (strain Y486) TaxID=1055687 RepID=G0TZ83_TRYVY|nr:hypothetical protein TVY486_0706060 [Trypanosoma vivax Y486]